MNPIEARYNGKFSAWSLNKSVDASTKITKSSLVQLYIDKPCRLVVESSPAVISDNKAPSIVYNVTLLCSKDLVIPPGSRITVTQEGRTNTFKASGMPAVYAWHQEITLDTCEGFA